MYECKIMIAEVPVRVKCLYPETREFLRAYLTEEEEAFCVEPEKEDFRKVHADLVRSAEKEGTRIPPYDERILERYAVHALLAEQLVHHGVLLMHGSALCMDEQAYLFTAPSGTGKSTHARLWREAFGDRVWMINDDKPMLRVEEGGVTVWGTPWDGKHHLSRNASAPLKAIVQIVRDKENRIFPMTKAEAFPLLMQQSYASTDPAAQLMILELEKRILNTIPFYVLHCNMDPEAAQVALEGMKE